MAAKQIWKFDIGSDALIELPLGAEILSAQIQRGSPVLWAKVDPGESKKVRRLHVAGTGHDLPDDLGEFIDTFQLENGLVFHLFNEAP